MNEQQDLFHLIPQVAVRLVRERMIEAPQVAGPEAAARIASEFLRDHDREAMIGIYLSTAGTVVGLSIISIGTLSASLVRVADAMKAALLSNAASWIAAHNHPSGNPEPSVEDIAVTRKLVEAGLLMDVPLRDHVIVTPDGGFTSLARRGLL